MKIGFLLSGSSPHSPGVKPFVPIGNELQSSGFDVTFIVNTHSPGVLDFAQEAGGEGSAFVCDSRNQMLRIGKYRSIDFLVGDDQLRSKEDVIWLGRRLCCKTVIYNHVLFGLHSLRPYQFAPALPLRSAIKFSASQAMPFSLLAARHRKLLSNADYLVANSQFTRTMVSTLYGADCSEIIYPPFSPEMFASIMRSVRPQGTTGSSLLIFAGGELDEPTTATLEECCDFAGRFDRVRVFGERGTVEFYTEALTQHGIPSDAYSGVSDSDLSKLYAENGVTFLPQRWETFGNVGAESIAHCRPVVMMHHQPWTEIIGPSEFAQIARHPSQGSQLDPFLTAPDSDAIQSLRNRVISALNPRNAAMRLVELLES